MILQKFPSHVDSIDCACEAVVSGAPDVVVVATSSLEGSLWDGGLHLLNTHTGAVSATVHSLVGISVARVVPYSSSSDVGDYSYSCISCMDDGKMAIHSVQQQSSGFSCSAVINAHSDCVSALSVNGSLFVSASWDGSIKCWDMNCTHWHPTQGIIDAHQKPVNDISISPSNANMLSSVGQDGFLRLWDTRDNMDAAGCVQIRGAREPISCVLWDLHDDCRLFVGTDSGRVLAYDTRISSSRSSSSDGRGSCSRSCHSSRPHRGRVRRMRSIQAQRDVLLTGSDDCSVLALRTSSIPLLSSSRTSSDYCSAGKHNEQHSAVLDR